MKTPLQSVTKPFHKSAGFSLVEVVLAVGIMALGVVTILGLLPHGLEMSRKTANEMAEARIIEHIVGELQNTNWSILDTYGKKVRYFDDQGLELVSIASAQDRFALSYVARVEIPQADVRLPTNNASLQPSNHLRRVTIRLVAAPLPDFNFDSPSSGVPVKVHTQLIANMATLANIP
ncbi:MAG TPA: hypothetical protein DIT13_15620 [Verrucomicrobiales bacterium]|nr:hypothetical protein [Verrucomicrobiales bacterium]HRJ07727.1 Verru_Chthon cassette protein B [Prosthecobacter sp.]HRK13629.1 Verru_Chthon cassette protein B [Prosthecobacter sp.]